MLSLSRRGLLLPVAVLAAVFPAAALAQRDPVAELGRSIVAGKVQVRFDEKRGYLPWLLEALNILPESQMLVFSKTSVQALRIEPANPRMLYFNDSVIVGTVQGGPIELVAQDPDKGLMFYMLDQTPFRYRELAALAKPISPFAPRVDCMTCHLSKSTGLAETLVRSVTTDQSGTPLEQYGVQNTDGRTPFEKLWGGWFVTGKGEVRHMGNTVRDAAGKPLPIKAPDTSDVAALMVFEHQMRMMNLIARVEMETRTSVRMSGAAQELADAMLFVDEARLPGRVEGSSGFAEKFAAEGPRDARGRSLRDLDLETRLLRYPCSYMIYSPAFDALPAEARKAVYARMWEALDKHGDTDRQAIIGILRDTKKDFPASRAAALREAGKR